MLFAERHQKLGRDHSLAHDRAEDLLTSTAFQLLRYIPPNIGLFAILRLAQTATLSPTGAAVVTSCCPDWLITCLQQATGYDAEFWQRWPKAGEPDVVLRLKGAQGFFARIVVEVKLDSPKSARDDEQAFEEDAPPLKRDQLWDYFTHPPKVPGEPVAGLIYLTAQPVPPYAELASSLACADREVDWLGWLSWQHVWLIACAIHNSLPATDLADILSLKGLSRFSGFRYDRLWCPPTSPPCFFHAWFSAHRRWQAPSEPHCFWRQKA